MSELWPCVAGNEITRNQRLALDQQKICFSDTYHFVADIANESKISRSGRSRDDFCFFLEPKKPDLVGASTSEEVEEELELIGVDGDCKEVDQI